MEHKSLKTAAHYIMLHRLTSFMAKYIRQRVLNRCNAVCPAYLPLAGCAFGSESPFWASIALAPAHDGCTTLFLTWLDIALACCLRSRAPTATAKQRWEAQIVAKV
eukprot:scaffold149354_cov35-Prasinocladus_malaysianus.AAC.1